MILPFIKNTHNIHDTQSIEMLSKRLNLERNRFWLLHLNSDVVESFDIFADNKYIRLIKNEQSIADILHGMYELC